MMAMPTILSSINVRAFYKTPLQVIVIVFFIVSAYLLPTAVQPGSADLANYCPAEGEVGEWRPIGTPQQAVGEDLFLLIDGGAEIYHEYGFYRALFITYQNPGGRKVNLELFEMADDDAAFGIYSFKTAAGGERIRLGDEALLEDYYLNMWQARFLVTLTGFDSEDDTIKGLTTLAGAVAAKIKVHGQRPELVALLPPENLPVGGITYLKGNLGLFNSYDLTAEDIFAVRQGVVGHYPGFKLIILQYQNPAERQQRFLHAVGRLKKNPACRAFSHLDEVWSFTDPQGRAAHLKAQGHYIFLISGVPRPKALTFFKEIESNLPPTHSPLERGV